MQRMQRPAWLRWQPVRLSLWLTLFLLAMGLPSIVLPLVREGPRLVSGSPDEPLRLVHRVLSDPTPPWLIAYALGTQGLLAWFTYFSGNAKVTDSDRFVVFLVLCLAAIGWLQTIAAALGK
jgi:hypothetical protein